MAPAWSRDSASRAESAQPGLDLFRVAGIRIAVDASWIVVFLLVAWSLIAGYFPSVAPEEETVAYVATGVAATLLFFASVLTHELAHAIVGNRLGQEVRRITLFIFGGMAHLSGEPRDPGTELRIAVVGPLTSVALGGLFWLLSSAVSQAGGGALAVALFEYLGFVNVALAVFNLLPGFPLDGGRLLRAALWKRWGNLRAATERASDWGSGIAIALMGLGALQIFAGGLVGGLWLIFIAMFLRGAARAGVTGVIVQQILGEATVREVMHPDPVRIDADASLAEVVEDRFLRYGYGAFPVASDGRVEGLLSIAEVRSRSPDERSRTRVHEVMRKDMEAIAIGPTASASDALQLMTEKGARQLLVTEDDRLVGLVTRSGLQRFVRLKHELESGSTAA